MTANIELLPKYTKGEEIQNSISHFLGAIFAIGTFITFFILGIHKGHSFVHMLPFFAYSSFMFLMFFVSGFYHSRPFNSYSRAYSRIIDHCDIYAFVAATYLPICIYGITNTSYTISLLIIEVSLGITGIILNLIPKETRLTKVITFIIYIIQGWAIILFYPFNSGLPQLSFIYILIGGIIYTIGSILYGIGHYKKWSHTIFHYFVLLAAVSQFIGILLLV